MKDPQVCFTSLKTNNNNNRIHRLDLDQLINILNLYLPFPDKYFKFFRYVNSHIVVGYIGFLIGKMKTNTPDVNFIAL